MKYLSLFSGIGGFELGVQQAYEETKSNRTLGDRKLSTEKTDIQQELHKPNSSSELGNGWGKCPECIGYSEIDKYAVQVYEKHFNHKNYGDITTITPNELPDFDLLVGGFPCQAFSIAGKRKGFEDTRGTLFFDIARILAEKKPRLVVLENVKGLLSHDRGKTFQTILGVLTDLGYFIEWQVLNSKNFGVPQNRERVFIIGYFGGQPRRKVFPITESGGETYIQQLNKPKHSNDRIYGTDGVSPTLNTAQGGNRQPFVTRQPLRFLTRNQKNIEGNYSFIVDASQTSGIRQDTRIRRLTPTECERLQGFPDGWTEGLSDTQRYKTLGNAVTVNVIEYIFR